MADEEIKRASNDAVFFIAAIIFKDKLFDTDYNQHWQTCMEAATVIVYKFEEHFGDKLTDPRQYKQLMAVLV